MTNHEVVNIEEQRISSKKILFVVLLGWTVGYGTAGMIPVWYIAKAGYKFHGVYWFGVMDNCFRGARDCSIDFGMASTIFGIFVGLIIYSISRVILKKNSIPNAVKSLNRLITVLVLFLFLLFAAYISVSKSIGNSNLAISKFIILGSTGLGSFLAYKLLKKS